MGSGPNYPMLSRCTTLWGGYCHLWALGRPFSLDWRDSVELEEGCSIEGSSRWVVAVDGVEGLVGPYQPAVMRPLLDQVQKELGVSIGRGEELTGSKSSRSPGKRLKAPKQLRRFGWAGRRIGSISEETLAHDSSWMTTRAMCGHGVTRTGEIID